MTRTTEAVRSTSHSSRKAEIALLRDTADGEGRALAATDPATMARELLVSVSHALRTPLASILGFASTLARQDVVFDAKERQEMSERLVDNARRVNEMVEDLLAVDRVGRRAETLTARPTDMVDLVWRMTRDADLGSRRVEFQAEPITITVDAAKVERMVQHLLLNAAQHTPASGRIWVRVRELEGGVVLIVEDDGPGIPDALKDVVFEPLRRGEGRSHAPSLGIGLALVGRHAELHGGHAWVQDRPGGGASFGMFLPCQDRA